MNWKKVWETLKIEKDVRLSGEFWTSQVDRKYFLSVNTWNKAMTSKAILHDSAIVFILSCWQHGNVHVRLYFEALWLTPVSVALDSKQIISRLSPQPTGLFTYGSHTALTVPSWHSYHFQYINNVCTWHLLLKFSDPFAELSLLRSRCFGCHATLPVISCARDNCSKNHSFEDQAHLISFPELSQGSISVSYSVYLVMPYQSSWEK